MDHKESWAPKNWCFWTVVLEKTLEHPLDSKEIKSVNPRGNQPWIFTGRTDAEDEAPILWPPDVKTWLFGKDPDAGKDWRQEEKGMTEDEMVGWHHKFGRWWGRPGVLQFIGLQRVRRLSDWTTARKKFMDIFFTSSGLLRARTDWSFRLCCSLRSLSKGTILAPFRNPFELLWLRARQ